MTLYFSTILFGTIFAVFITWLCSIKFGFLSQKPGHYSNQGTEFDIRGFHEIILEEGTVTLSILENRILNYIERVK